MDTEPEDTQAPTPVPTSTDQALEEAMKSLDKDPKKMLEGIPSVDESNKK